VRIDAGVPKNLRPRSTARAFSAAMLGIAACAGHAAEYPTKRKVVKASGAKFE